jgi:hypothetical protein
MGPTEYYPQTVDMTACLAGYGLLGFELYKTFISKDYFNPWTI